MDDLGSRWSGPNSVPKCQTLCKVTAQVFQFEAVWKTHPGIGRVQREPTADLDGAILTGAILDHANLGNANLDRANLRGARLDGAYLRDAHLTRAILTGAILTGADLRLANLTSAILNSADLTDAILTAVRWPDDAPVPEGWKRSADSDRLRAADTGPARTGTP
jgi:uncharacterized protein YjbI with pentapeptide repeats